MNAERIEQARRFGGELCDIDGCTEYGTLEHVTAHLADAESHRFVPGSRYQPGTSEDRCTRCGGAERSHRSWVDLLNEWRPI
jgi:hypothetical protein